eukprot:4934765-Prymnesium_polylepis.1
MNCSADRRAVALLRASDDRKLDLQQTASWIGDARRPARLVAALVVARAVAAGRQLLEVEHQLVPDDRGACIKGADREKPLLHLVAAQTMVCREVPRPRLSESAHAARCAQRRAPVERVVDQVDAEQSVHGESLRWRRGVVESLQQQLLSGI